MNIAIVTLDSTVSYLFTYMYIPFVFDCLQYANFNTVTMSDSQR